MNISESHQYTFPSTQHNSNNSHFETQSNEKDSIICIENTMESKQTHHEIEEEVASLLLDIRDRCDTIGIT
jgi:hypothetical protein